MTEAPRCPKCLKKFKQGLTPHVLKTAMDKHIDSKPCRENQERLQYALAEREKAMDDTPVGVEQIDPNKAMDEIERKAREKVSEQLQEEVIFSSPSSMLLVWLIEPTEVITAYGVVRDPGLKAEFHGGTFKTRDLRTIQLMRASVSNVANMHDIADGALKWRKDRFYEIPNVREAIEPEAASF